jgi:hypothetical protein
MKMYRYKITPKMGAFLYGIASFAMLLMLGFMIWANIEAKKSHDRIMEMSDKKLQEIERRKIDRDGF